MVAVRISMQRSDNSYYVLALRELFLTYRCGRSRSFDGVQNPFSLEGDSQIVSILKDGQKMATGDRIPWDRRVTEVCMPLPAHVLFHLFRKPISARYCNGKRIGQTYRSPKTARSIHSVLKISHFRLYAADSVTLIWSRTFCFDFCLRWFLFCGRWTGRWKWDEYTE